MNSPHATILRAMFLLALWCDGCAVAARRPQYDVVTVESPTGQKDLYVPGGLKCDPHRPQTEPGGLYWDGRLKSGDTIETVDGRTFSFEQIQHAILKSPENGRFVVDSNGQIVRGFLR